MTVGRGAGNLLSMQQPELENPRPQHKLHYFGADEEEYVQRIADRRTKLIRPLAMLFVRRNVRSDSLTLFSFLLVPLVFFPLFGLKQYIWCWIVLTLHILLDGLDGPVARLGRYASDKGALSDILNDITGMVVVMLTAMQFGFAYPMAGGLYIATYLYMIIMIIARNIMEMPFKVVFKSKYWMFVFLLVTVHSGYDLLNPFLLIMSVYQAVIAAVGVFHLRRHLPGILGAGTSGAWPGPDKVAGRETRLMRRMERKERRQVWLKRKKT
ncbi:MAG TPA: CDP-alcohol phosphatidyltransferase family protein [bacterium]|nr:CDP-alcohol phosphatidyltransferase family protein [bacterium]